MKTFEYQRRVAFSDTDAMGVTHHANYLRFAEEARVAWMRERGLSHTHFPHTDHVLALIHYQVWHFRPSTFDDALKIQLQVRGTGVKIRYQYKVFLGEELIAEAETLHVPVDGKLKLVRPNARLTSTLEKEPWIETWLSNS
jgi:acyl-CoA thioester hydrolase